MQVETIIKVITAIGAIAGVAKIIYDITIGGKPRLREDYKFAKEFFEDLEKNPKLHPFVVEKGYQAIAGSRFVSSEEIAYLLSLKDPNKCLNDYLLSKQYLQKLNNNEEAYLSFSKRYSSSLSRNWRKLMFFTLYVCFALIAILPILVPQHFHLIIITFPVSGYAAFNSLVEFIKIYRGEQLVRNQQRHTSTLHLPRTSTYRRENL